MVQPGQTGAIDSTCRVGNPGQNAYCSRADLTVGYGWLSLRCSSAEMDMAQQVTGLSHYHHPPLSLRIALPRGQSAILPLMAKMRMPAKIEQCVTSGR